jgi:putative transposase
VIDAEKANYPVAWMCRLLRVPRSSFYAWRNRAETASAARRRQLAALVTKAFKDGRAPANSGRPGARIGT